jgi:hypothetical protein
MCRNVRLLSVLLFLTGITTSTARAQTVVPLTITESSSQYPGTPGSGSSPNCPNTTISISVSFSAPGQYGSIAEALAAGSQIFGTGVGTAQAVNYHGDQCQPELSSVGPETYNVLFTKNTLGIQGIPENIGIGAVTPGAWRVSPTAITYGGAYIQNFGGPQVGSISFSINGDIGAARITILTGVLKDTGNDAISGQPFDAALIATGGTAPYTWSFSSSPALSGFFTEGTSLRCCLESAPGATPGTYQVTLDVTDSHGAVGEKTVPLIVLPGLCAPVVENPIPNQGTDATDIDGDGFLDLVAGRGAVIRVPVTIPASCADTDSLHVSATISSTSFAPSRDFLISSWRQSPVWEFRLSPNDLPAGPATITIQSSVGSVPQPLVFSVSRVRDLKYQYFNVDYLGPNIFIDDTVRDANNLIQAVFPVATGHLFTATSPTAFSALPGPPGAWADAASLFILKHLLGLERAIGVVPSPWFPFHFYSTDTVGIQFPNIAGVAFVTDGYPEVVAHELGHTYGFVDSYHTSPCCFFNGIPISDSDHPRWVTPTPTGLPPQQVEQTFQLDCLDIHCTLDVMSAADREFGIGRYPTLPTERWTTPQEFAELFRQFRSAPPDPPTLLITGSISQTGSATFDRIYRSEVGTLSTPHDGDGIIRLVDDQGTVLAQLTFPFDFTVLTDPPVTADEVPFGFALPDYPNAARVEVLRSGVLEGVVDVRSKLLRDAVESLPDNAFVNGNTARKTALLNKVDAFERQLAAGAKNGALNNLRNDIRKTLSDWLIDGYQTTSPLQYTKAAILNLVDDLSGRLTR